MNAQAHYQQLVALIGRIPTIVSSNLTYREIDDNECYIKGILHFGSGHELHIAEYVISRGDTTTREKYRYQLMNASKQQLARWDNAPHHPELSTFPYHQHETSDTAHAFRAMGLAEAIAESVAIIESASG